VTRLLVLVAGVAGSLILMGWASADSSARTLRNHRTVPPIPAVVLTKAQLEAEAKNLREPFYWAGAEKGYEYEFRRTASDDVYLRYLPSGVKAGAPGAKYLIVARYPVKHAFAHLKRQARGNDIAGPRGSIIFVDPQHPTDVFMAFRAVNYEIEIYFHRPATALAIAKSGNVRRVKASGA